MDDLVDRLKAAWAMLNDDGDEYGLCDTLSEAAAALEAARADAERWRALREMDGGEIYALLGDCDGIHPEQADAAIDQARGKGIVPDAPFAPDWVSPPGDTIADVLEERGWTQAELARRLGYTEKHVSQLINGKAAITEDTASRLERVLGSTAGFWLRREATYRERLERQQFAQQPAAVDEAKEFAHRPGPWHVSEHTEGSAALIYDADGFEVARVCYPNRNADAKLIAAAPELLQSASAALHYMRLHKYADQAWADDLEAAIAAATSA